MTARDPICGAEVDTLRARAVAIVDGKTHYFCSAAHKTEFLKKRGTERGQYRPPAAPVAPIAPQPPSKKTLPTPEPRPAPPPPSPPVEHDEPPPASAADTVDDDEELEIIPPMRKTSPLVYLVAVVVLAAIAVGLGLLARRP